MAEPLVDPKFLQDLSEEDFLSAFARPELPIASRVLMKAWWEALSGKTLSPRAYRELMTLPPPEFVL